MTRFVVPFVLAMGVHLGNVVAAEDAQQATPTEFRVGPIGHVKMADDQALIVLDKRYQPGLLGLDQSLRIGR